MTRQRGGGVEVVVVVCRDGEERVEGLSDPSGADEVSVVVEEGRFGFLRLIPPTRTMS